MTWPIHSCINSQQNKTQQTLKGQKEEFDILVPT